MCLTMLQPILPASTENITKQVQQNHMINDRKPYTFDLVQPVHKSLYFSPNQFPLVSHWLQN